MIRISRRELARYAADELLNGKAASVLGRELAAAIVQSGVTIEPQFLLADIAEQLEMRRELAIGHVTASRKLDGRVRSTLLTQLKKTTGARRIALEEEIDPKLIGGLRLETSNRVWDFSLSRQLQELKEIL